MRLTIKLLLVLFNIIICTSVYSQETEKTVSITVSGSGKTQDEAKQSALRSAIEQAFGSFISSKTEILNDQVVADQMASVSNGNIQSYEMLNESQLPNGTWGVTLRAMVSINKLTSFVQAKGIAVEIKGGLFAANIKQQLLNEEGEIKAISEMMGLIHEPMQISFDYKLKSDEPKSIDTDSKNWVITLQVIATANKNMDFCANYYIKTLAALSLSAEEVANYKSLNKAVFPVVINYKGISKTFYLRKRNSISALKTLNMQWDFYTRLFIVQSKLDETYGTGKEKIYDFRTPKNDEKDAININFLTIGELAATFSWDDQLTLSQIETMTGYSVKPRGVVSQFKYGGFVVYGENGGNCLVAAIMDLGEIEWDSAKTACDELILNGYDDWHLPTSEQLESIYYIMGPFGIGGFKTGNSYWSSTEIAGDRVLIQNFQYPKQGGIEKHYECYVRAVRFFKNL